MLIELRPTFADLADWNAGAIEAAVNALATGRQLKLNNVAQPLRTAVTGSNV